MLCIYVNSSVKLKIDLKSGIRAWKMCEFWPYNKCMNPVNTAAAVLRLCNWGSTLCWFPSFTSYSAAGVLSQTLFFFLRRKKGHYSVYFSMAFYKSDHGTIASKMVVGFFFFRNIPKVIIDKIIFRALVLESSLFQGTILSHLQLLGPTGENPDFRLIPHR